MIAFRKLFAFAATGLAIGFAAPALAQQTVKVGSTPTGIPFTFLDTQSNTIQGVMVDIITAIGKDAGFSVQVEPMQFSTLIGAQRQDYLERTLREYKSGERRGYDPAMAEVVQEIADADLAAVAHYLAYWR